MSDQHQSSHQQSVRERAYAIWEAQGRPEGRDQEHWDQAAREIDDLQKDGGGALQQAASPAKTRRASSAKGASPAKRGVPKASAPSASPDSAPVASPAPAASPARGRKKKSDGTSASKKTSSKT